MIEIESKKVSCDKHDGNYVYVHYSIAKEAGIKIGIEFRLNDPFHTQIIVKDYVNYRNDICQNFSGFRCRVLTL